MVDKSIIRFDSILVENPLCRSVTSLRYNNIPASLHSVKKGIIWFSFSQFLYQNVHSGNLSKDLYEQFCKQRNLFITKKDLSTEPIDCYVLVVSGINRNGEEVLLIDADNDKDFAGELPFTVPEYKSDDDFEQSLPNAIEVDYQAVFNKQVIRRRIPLLFLKGKDRLFYSIPQYAVAKLKVNNVVHEIAVSHEFRFPDYSVANIVGLTEQKSAIDNIAHKNQLLRIDNHFFKNMGVNYASLNLLLEEVKDTVAGTQKGMQAVLFNGMDVISGRKISLADFKGKYLFIDFWGTWCGPCVAQLPRLKEIYATLDKSKVAFLGIAGNDEIKGLRKMVYEKQLLWQNILSDSLNQIVERYGVLAYPTGMLIDPTGKIDETEVSSINLEDILKRYLSN